MDGTSYEGEWQNHKFHGEGKLSRPDGEVYTGTFEANVKHGTGEQVYPDGSKV